MIKSSFEDCTLTMIVRDEMMNAAGGLLSTINQHAHFFPELVIVDTGSVDETRKLLEYLQGKYPHLRVFDHAFRGYADARNFAKDQVRTKYAFSLDADELFPEESIIAMMKNVEKKERLAYEVDIFTVAPEGKPEISHFCFRKRFYQPSQVRFEGLLWETLSLSHLEHDQSNTSNVALYHFVSSSNSFDEKLQYWYWNFESGRKIPEFAPSQYVGFKDYKIPSPVILQQYGIDLREVLTELSQQGLNLHQDFDYLNSAGPKQ